MKSIISGGTALALLATSLAGAAPAAAQTAAGFGDLIGMRGSSIENEMTSRGYSFAKNVGSAAMWWNASSKSCVSVAVDDGRVASIQSASASDCGHGGGNDALVGLALGAAAVGLVAALSSHHDKSEQRNNHSSYNAEYERGYNDGLYAAHYAQNDSEAYHSGYLAGETERQNRRAANTHLVRGAPRDAQVACSRRGDEVWRVPAGSTAPVSVFDYGQGNYEITVASGHRRASCSVNAGGQVSDFQPH